MCVDVVLLLFWVVAVVAKMMDIEVVLIWSSAVVLLVVLGAVVDETVDSRVKMAAYGVRRGETSS